MPGSGAAQGPCTLAVPLPGNTAPLPKGRLCGIKTARRGMAVWLRGEERIKCQYKSRKAVAPFLTAFDDGIIACLLGVCEGQFFGFSAAKRYPIKNVMMVLAMSRAEERTLLVWPPKLMTIVSTT